MTLRALIRRVVPRTVRREMILAFPSLYRTRWISYETNIGKAVDELLGQLDLTLDVAGDIAECGSAACGTSVIMAEHLRRRGIRKTIYAYDSFEGFDRSELARERGEGLTEEGDEAFTSSPLAYVNRKIRRLGYAGVVVPVKGYFQQTLPQSSGPVSFALIDCDLRDSVLYCAEQIWPRLSRGGRIVFDDYRSTNYRGARLGIDQFLAQHRDEITEHGLIRRLYYVYKA